MNELDTFLETPESAEATTTTEAAATTEATTETKTTDGKGAQNAETPAAVTDESTANDVPPKGHIPIAAYLDEKGKRQELQRRLEALEKPQKQEEKVDLFVDPDGFVKGVDNKIQQVALNDRISMSREFMLELKPDYAEKEARFVEMTKADPSLIAKMNASAMPAKFAYNIAAKALTDEAKQKLLDEVGDLDALREKIRLEEVAKLQGSQPTKPVKPIVEKAPSLATASAARSNTEVIPETLEDLFQR